MMKKKKKTKRVYFIVSSVTNKPVSSECDVYDYHSSVACYTNNKDAKRHLSSLTQSFGYLLNYKLVSFDLTF